ncbi:protein mini spindles [Schistocerca cancellata]|uniref:protein mini spindles n=1 Tax=Schistocerca cancellata TaxID=274614 RepID=UPI002117C49E|nr:protein mini spindles [Schistocerca cancellata]XP_049764941.1 protein mini spindles [Schistocerca cancellata]
MEENTEYLKLPVEEQCVHKQWKARLHGYEEAAKIFRQVDDEKSPEFAKYLGLLKKFVVDSNAVAQEKGLEAVLAFVENSASAGKTVGEVMAGIVTKCIAAPKTKTKELAVQITLMYIEIEKCEAVQEELLKGMEHKNPKTVAACVAAMTEALREFGIKVINIKPLVKKIPVLLEDRDKTVRDEGKALVIEMYRWIGAALKPQLTALKPVQVTELETEFEKVKGMKVAPTRYLRSQQQKQAKLAAEMAASDDIGEEDEEDGAAPEVDPYDLMEPVDILSKLPKDFYEKLEAVKWQERKEAVDSLEQLLQTPKLENGDYGDLVRSLKKVVGKDTNVMVIAVAGKCLAALANGLKKRFQPYASQCIPTILEKFREKKQNVVTALREAIDAIYVSTTIEAIQEDCLEALENKNPSVKAETASFLARCFTKCTPMMLTKKPLKAYTTALLKLLNNPDPTVRDNAAEALGTAMKVVGEKAIMPFLADIEAIKMTKIKECCEKAVIVAKVPRVVERPSSAPTKLGGDGDGKTVGAKAAKKSAPSGTKKVVKKAVSSAPAVGSGKKLPTQSSEKELSEDVVDEILSEILPGDLISGLEDTNWKVRLAAVEQFVEVVRVLDPADRPTQALVRALSKKPGLKDTNFQVLKAKLEVLKLLAETGEMSSVSVECCVSDVAEKLGDPKNGTLAAETLTALAEATKLDPVATAVLDFAFSQKSPKVQIEALNWLAEAIKEFGFVVQPKALMDSVRKAVGATHPGVRSAGIAFTGTLYLYIGQQLSVFFEGEKPALLQQITAEWEKHDGETPPDPVRRQKGADGDAESPEEVKVNMHDMIEKVDISSHITDALLSELADKNWKVRIEALQKLVNIVNEHKYISSNLGDLPPVLALRLVDSNSKIAVAAIAFCQSLGAAMGSQCKVHVRTLFPNFLQGLGDSKVWVRSAASACINTWGDQCGYKVFFDGEMIGDALKSGSPVLRSELWAWLAEKLPDIPPKSFPREELTVCVPHLFSNLEDRNADVRKSAQDAVPAFLIHLGHTSLMKAVAKLKPATQSVITQIIMKANVPVKQMADEEQECVKTVKSGGAKAAGSSTAVKNKAAAPKSGKTGGRKKDEEADTSPLLQINGQKHQRLLDEQKLKVLKWNFTSPREEFVEQLKDAMTAANVNRTLTANMFHSDFKYHLKAIDMLNEDLPNNPAATVANLDLILKWMTLRFFDTNPSVILKGLEYLHTVFDSLIEENYNMFEQEALSFVPYLILKIGDPKDAVRNSVKSLFKQLERIYPASKLFVYIMDGLKSKNARQRTECLELLGYLIEGYGLSVCQPSPVAALKEIAKQISDRDNSVRNAALNCVVQAYFIEGDKVYKMVGQICDKDLSLLEERIKRAAKNRPPSATRQSPPSGRPSSQPQLPARQAQVQKVTRQGSEGSIQRETVATPTHQEVEVPPAEPQPRQTPPKQQRPVSGRFGLDPELLAKIEGKGVSLSAPKLNEFDLKDILDDGTPIDMPKPGYQNSGSPVSYQPVKQRLPASYAQASRPEEVIEMGISNVTNPDINVAWQACVQLELVVQTENVSFLRGKEDHLVLACVMQLRLLNSSSPHSTPGDLLARGYRNLFLLLMSFFEKSHLAKRVSKKVLHDLVYQLLGLLVDRHLDELENGDSFTRVVNVMVMRIIENSDPTNITSAMMKSLHDCVASTNASARFTELVMKCLWRIIKLLPQWEEETDFAVILYDIHLFLKDFPSPVWKKRQSDVPLRTIKTFIHTVTKIKGNRILNYLGRIDNASDSELHSYLIKLLKNAKQDDVKSSTEKDAKIPNRHTKVPYGQLSEIFKKIGMKNHTREGLELLYNFKEQYPDANLDSFLRKSSPQFQDYIAKGLKSIEMERKKEPFAPANTVFPVESTMKDKEVPAKNNTPRVENLIDVDGDGRPTSKDAQYYLKRLQRLQADAGLTPANIPLGLTLRQQTTVSDNNIPNDENLNVRVLKENRSEILPTSRSGADGVERLRKRLEALKSTTK